MIRQNNCLGAGLLVWAALMCGHGWAQTKPAGENVKLQRLLDRFPKADANGDGILTQREAEEYKKVKGRGKMDEPIAGDATLAAPYANVAYGAHERNTLDFWPAKSDRPTPVLIYFHGGSFKAGDKSAVLTRPVFEQCLKSGIGVVSANYRFSSDAPYPASMQDGARAVQFVRSQAKQWNIDPARIAVSGTSAGATLALWIALHDDLADPSSADAVLQCSSRVTCASLHSGTAGLESQYFKKQAGVSKQGAALWQLFSATSQAEFDSPTKQALAREASPLAHASRDDPPLFLTYQGDPGEAPFAAEAAQSNWIHHVCLGLPLRAKYDELGCDSEFYYKSNPPAEGAEIAFLTKHLFAASEAPVVAPHQAPPASHIYKSLGERKLQLVMHYPTGWQAQDKRTAVLFFSGSHKVQPDANGKLPPLADERVKLGLPVVNRGPGGEHHVAFLDGFAKRGYVGLHVEYRTRGKDGVLPGEDIADAVSAIRWVRGHAGELGIDPQRIVAAGGSSGAYLAASLFAFEDRHPATGNSAVSARPNAIVLYSPLIDWLEVGSMSESFLVVLGGDKELGARISPARHWRKDCPPTLVMVGSEEPPFATVKQFAERWRAEGSPVELFVAEGAKHGFFAQPAWVEKTNARTDEFLTKHKLEPVVAPMNAAPANARAVSEIYKSIGERKLHTALHFPPNWKPTDSRSAILLFGGGGFNPQDKETGETISSDVDQKQPDQAANGGGPGQAFLAEAEHFARLGLVAFRVEYRKRKTDGVLPDKAVEDAKSAMRWVRSNATRFGIDPSRVVACGGSSGGHLAASLAALGEFNASGDDLQYSAKPNLLILHYPLLDFLAGGTRKLQFLDALGGDKDLGERLSPARHWTKDMPPTLIFIGTKDPTFEAASSFVAKWKAVGGNLDLFIGEGAGHGFSSTPAWHDRTLPRMEAFLRQAGYIEPIL